MSGRALLGMAMMVIGFVGLMVGSLINAPLKEPGQIAAFIAVAMLMPCGAILATHESRKQ